jgi:hypothetical protein
MPSNYQSDLGATAVEQFNKYRNFNETDTPLANQIRKYWSETGFGFTSVDVPWSAVFISWCVKKAGAADGEFLFNPQHSQFVFWAINQASKPNALFKGRDPALYAPKIGDIIQNNRGAAMTFGTAATTKSYASHSAIVIEEGMDGEGRYVRTVGGNEGDTVGRRKIKLFANGKIRNPNGYYIAIIETLK